MPNPFLDTMTDAANRFLDGLDQIQRGRATRPFSDERERTEWYYTPNVRPGIPLIELDAVQQQMVRRLVYSGLSEGGYNTAATIMGLEAILAPVEHWTEAPFVGYEGPAKSVLRDPAMYFMCVFGTPGDDRWGWSFGGHHVSVHYTVVGGEISANPCFFGAHPAVSPLQPGLLLEPLAAERKLGLKLLQMLDAGQRQKATLVARAPHDIVTANRPNVPEGARPLFPWVIMEKVIPPWLADRQKARWATDPTNRGLSEEEYERISYVATPKGLAAGDMTGPQRAALQDLVGVYLGRLPEAVAATEAERIRGGLDAFHFAWAGGDSDLPAHYYRIQGPRLLIEYDSPFDDGCHIHAVIRDPEGDFGMDLLARHYAESHR